MQYGGRPVMFTQVVVFGNNLLQAELDQRSPFFLLFLSNVIRYEHSYHVTLILATTP